MIKLPPDITHDDVRLWLSGTVFLMKVRGREGLIGDYRPVHWEGMDGPNLIATDIVSGEQVLAHHRTCAGYWPRVGSVNLETGIAVHVDRLVTRQARRSLYRSGLLLTVPHEIRMARKYGEEHSLWGDFALYKALYFPTYPTYGEAMDRLLSGSISVALSPRVILAGDPHGKRQFFYNGNLVASIWGDALLPAYPGAPVDKVEGFVKEALCRIGS